MIFIHFCMRAYTFFEVYQVIINFVDLHDQQRLFFLFKSWKKKPRQIEKCNTDLYLPTCPLCYWRLQIMLLCYEVRWKITNKLGKNKFFITKKLVNPLLRPHPHSTFTMQWHSMAKKKISYIFRMKKPEQTDRK